MALNFDVFKIVEVKNPSKDCTELFFSNKKAGKIQNTSLVIFEQQVKYIVTEKYETHKKVKIYIRDDDAPIIVDFYPEEYHLYESFFMSLYNKNI